jgi:hypothetical protein
MKIYIILMTCMLALGTTNLKADDPLLIEPIIQAAIPGEHYVGRVKINNISVRLLVLKHSMDSIGNTDAQQAISAANLAASKGLAIRDIGNYHIDRGGKKPVVWGKKRVMWPRLKEFISEQMKVGAVSGDTLVIYTIGHGGGGGGLQNLGQRAELMRIMAEAAEENNQETFWWQLSCYAAAGLPPVSSLNPTQQDLFAMIASSPANQSSYFCTQGAQMEKVFCAMAEGSTAIDPDQNGTIVAKELSDFLDAAVSKGRGDLVYAKNEQEPIFGLRGLARLIPIRDMVGGQKNYPSDYIPLPRGR